jgi:hypothetical protein
MITFTQADVDYYKARDEYNTLCHLREEIVLNHNELMQKLDAQLIEKRNALDEAIKYI